jgi:uncharacterized protein (DUF1501 family)
MKLLNRRQSLVCLAAGAASLSFPAFASARDPDARRLVAIILRGGLDGLAAVAPLGDPAHQSARQGLALGAVGAQTAIPLDGFFALHPALTTLADLWAANELIAVHATGTPYRDRSHFDAQNVLETGARAPHARPTGWLNAALANLPPQSRAGRTELGIAILQQAPLILRGAAAAATWSASTLPDTDGDTLNRLMALYGGEDPAMARALAAAKDANLLAADLHQTGGPNAFAPLAQAAGRFLKQPEGPVAAVLELGGWDTHYNQATLLGPLTRNLLRLDQGIAALKDELGAAWASTVVVVMTEFGRTVAMNGTGGTDHGTGGVAFLAGGNVKGGVVIADWPGLGPRDLDEGRDLRVTTDLYGVLKGVLQDHLGVARARLEHDVFPGSTALPHAGLIRVVRAL